MRGRGWGWYGSCRGRELPAEKDADTALLWACKGSCTWGAVFVIQPTAHNAKPKSDNHLTSFQCGTSACNAKCGGDDGAAWGPELPAEKDGDAVFLWAAKVWACKGLGLQRFGLQRFGLVTSCLVTSVLFVHHSSFAHIAWRLMII
jgi:hypothetical protein